MKNIIIVGGGAAAFMAAITAAENGAYVTVLEKENRPLKKFAMTGNGKCNISNLNICDDSFRSHDADRAYSIVSSFPPEKAIAFFERIGLPCFEKNGWVYPRCENARSAAYMLEGAAKRAGVKIKTLQDVSGIESDALGAIVKVPGWAYECDGVICACGTKASLSDSSNDLARELAGRYSLAYYPYLAALCPILCIDERVSSWPKVRAKAAVRVYVNGQIRSEKRGELQLSPDGISGIAAMQTSRYIEEALYRNESCSLEIDFAPDQTTGSLKDYLYSLLEAGIPKEDLLTGMIPPGITHSFCCDDIGATAESLKYFKIDSFRPSGIKISQVCQGGIALSSLDESLKIRGTNIYICGEMLDVDGDCGGYNLQWAWSSGYAAGKAASES